MMRVHRSASRDGGAIRSVDRVTRRTEAQSSAASEAARDTGGIFTLLPVAACFFAIFLSPIHDYFLSGSQAISAAEAGVINRFFWPVMTVLVVFGVAQNVGRGETRSWPPCAKWLFAYLGLAGLSIAWSFKPPSSTVRFIQEAMVLAAIMLPPLLADYRRDVPRAMFYCFCFAALVNCVFMYYNDPLQIIYYGGYYGYFSGKNYLGEFAAVGIVLALHELLYPGARRYLGIGGLIVFMALNLLSHSKTALGLSLLCPLLAVMLIKSSRASKISIPVQLVIALAMIVVGTTATGIGFGRLSYLIYGDPTFTGRTVIWDFSQSQIAQRPWIGVGYQSFWLVGSDGLSMQAPGWIRSMPNSHNGYLDVMLELGIAGLAALLAFVFATFHGIGKVVAIDTKRGWFLLALALYVTLYNFLESSWFRGYEMLWVAFVLVMADVTAIVRRGMLAQGASVPAEAVTRAHTSGMRGSRPGLPRRPIAAAAQ